MPDRIFFQPAGITGQIGSYIGPVVTAALTVGQLFTIPQGAWIVMPVANIVVEIQDPSATWTVIFASAVGGYMVSDGTNMRIRATGSGTYKLYKYL